MGKAPTVIHQRGRPMKATDVDGRTIEREEYIYVKSHRQWYPVLDYDNHFVYRTDKTGAALLCTCGSVAAAVGYDAYKQYCSFKGMQVVACLNHTNYGVHADGSH